MGSRGGRDMHRPPDSLNGSVIAIEKVDKVGPSANEENDGGDMEAVMSISQRDITDNNNDGRGVKQRHTRWNTSDAATCWACRYPFAAGFPSS